MKKGPQKPRKLRPPVTPRASPTPTLRLTIPAKEQDLMVPIAKLPPPPRHAADMSDGEAFSQILRVQGGDKYKIGPVLAEGGMGTVREAMDIHCRRIVAIKELHKDRPLADADITRFIEEAQITSQLEHPNIVPIHELGFDTDQNAFYAMKFVHGVTLTDILIRIRKGEKTFIEQYPLSRLLNIFQKVCDAIAFAHSRGIVHCDLKPDNIMICDFGEVMVMDWGLARPEGSLLPMERVHVEKTPNVENTGDGNFDTTTRTTTGRILGTPGFIAPERIRGGTVVECASDIYSLGATLYSILTLHPPIAGGDITQIIQRILTGDIRPAVTWNDEPVSHGFPHCSDGKIPAPLSEIAMKALSIDPADRYASVQDFQHEVESYQNGNIWHVVVDQDFKGENPLARWDVIGGLCEVKNGELHMSHGEPQVLAFKGDLPIDVRIEFEGREENVYLNSIGCFMSAVRNATPKELALTGYKFELGGFDNSANVLDRLGRQIARQQIAALERGRSYRIRVERVGNRLRVVVDDKEIFNVVDPDPLSGSDRTIVGIFGWLAESIITRVKISTLGAPWKSDILDIADRQSLKGNYDVAMALVKEVVESFPEPARLERARNTEQMIMRRQKMTHDLAGWRKKLSRAWPHARFDLRSTNDGFTLAIENCGIEDLTPIADIPLVALICPNNRIKSLEPIRGMPLTTLNCIGNPITDIGPLHGMPLNTLVCEGCPIESLEPLRDVPITLLNIGGGHITDIEPLRGMPLTFLACWGNRIRDLGPLSDKKYMAALYCSANEIESLEPLRGLSIVSMNCSGNRITSLAPLSGMPLGVLHCGDNRIESLEPLRGLPLKMLSCQANQIKTLEPLVGMGLSSLVCGRNPITSCEPLVENPPDDFRYESASIPKAELKRMRTVWVSRINNPAHVRLVDTLLAIRDSNTAALRKLALKYNGHHYLFIPMFLTWTEAKAFCEKLGGHLLTITSKEENGFLASVFPNGSWFWMGLYTSERGHEWVTGEPFDFNNYMDPQHEHKRGPKIFSGRWTADDVPTGNNSFMIEWED